MSAKPRTFYILIERNKTKHYVRLNGKPLERLIPEEGELKGRMFQFKGEVTNGGFRVLQEV